jgi:SAM-dependent methyltransferase
MCYTNPRPSARSLGRFYPRDYRPHQSSGERGRQPRNSVFARWRRAESPLPWHGHGRLLDFGCGGGDFLVTMHRHGWEVTGIDTAEEAVARVRRETGLPVLEGTLPHPDLEPASFDVITMWHALEHVPHPRVVVREAHRLLAPGGRLVVAVPNIDSFAFRTFGPYWFGLDLPRHLSHFAPWTLQLLLEQCGFRLLELKMVRRSAWLRHSARLACGDRRANLWHRLLRTKPVSRLAAWYSCVSNQSDSMVVTAEVGG